MGLVTCLTVVTVESISSNSSHRGKTSMITARDFIGGVVSVHFVVFMVVSVLTAFGDAIGRPV